MGLEDKYLDVLQNIEFAIIGVYRKHGDLTDHDAMDALDALIGHYRAELRGLVPRESHLKGNAETVFRQTQDICEWRLGRSNTLFGVEQPSPRMTLDKIVACLRKIRGSVEFWNGEGGRQGYLRYVSQFMT